MQPSSHKELEKEVESRYAKSSDSKSDRYAHGNNVR